MLERFRSLPERTRRLVVVGVGGVLVLAIAGIALSLSGPGGDDDTTTTTAAADSTTTTTEPEETTTTEPEETTTTGPEGPPSPLNGLPVADEELLDRRVVAIKIDNHASARPQSGLDTADAVYELLVEGGMTRFIGLFHHSDTDSVGPIRSARPTDPELVHNSSGTMVVSGAQAWVQALVRSRGVPLIGEVRPGTYRIGTRSAPHNLYGDTALLRTEHADRLGYPDEPPAGPLFVWGALRDTAPATELTFDWSDDQPTVRWVHQGGEYLRFIGANAHTHLDRDGVQQQVAVDTIVVLEARRYSACPTSGQAGSCVPAMETVGTGRALVFHGGEVQEGRWSRGTTDIPFALDAADGRTMQVPPGRMWIAVFPAGRTIGW
jgi:hypothetical protein